MACTRIREAISAAMDGESPGVALGVVEDHLRRCAACRGFADSAAELGTAVRFLRADHGPPDLKTRIVARVMADRESRLWTGPIRIGLVVVAVAQLALAIPSLVFGSDDGAPVHIAHEIGSWDVALAVALLFAAWRPLRALGLLPFVAALAAGLLGTALLDVLNGRAVAVVETTHLLELVGAMLLWLLTRPPVARRTERMLEPV